MTSPLTNDQREAWQRGPVRNIPALLQPVAHALIQAGEDAEKYTLDLNNTTLWSKPGNVASVGFHLRHITGVLDRLFTYAAGNALDDRQLDFLKKEENPDGEFIQKETLLRDLRIKIDETLKILETIDTASLTEIRYLGRSRIPTTKMGLMFHAAEHAQRHIGQVLVTVRWVNQEQRYQ